MTTPHPPIPKPRIFKPKPTVLPRKQLPLADQARTVDGEEEEEEEEEERMAIYFERKTFLIDERKTFVVDNERNLREPTPRLSQIAVVVNDRCLSAESTETLLPARFSHDQTFTTRSSSTSLGSSFDSILACCSEEDFESRKRGES
ncbi:unnamed protein product, partial [Mesorhabditis belari]|uniref:Uncharacterized protein n=1 Tax=Mesorhabditis belari TaxID=2138241 RepID=A0AAF3EL54_9BILA